MKKYKHLTEKERELIFLYHNQGKSYRQIAKLIARDHRTVGRELKRNSCSDEDENKPSYSPFKAQEIAERRRKEAKTGLSKMDNPVLRSYVIKKIGKGWSPEQIAGRLKLKLPDLYVSYETIYKFIYARENRHLRLWELLRKRHRKRRRAKGRKAKEMIPNRVFIDKRPKGANSRKEIGHWETDNMEGPRKNKDCVSVNVERKYLVVKLDKLRNKKSAEKRDSLINQFNKYPDNLVKTFTFDNGPENHQHQQIAKGLNCKTYFCNPYHSWEKGTVENTIGLIRQYLPKGTNLAKITKGDLSWIADELNSRPRKKLGFYTPSEMFYKETGWVT